MLTSLYHNDKYRRAGSYILSVLGLLLIYLLTSQLNWQGSTELHTLMEVIATMLALMTGVMALIRYYSRYSNTFLLIGVAFIGTAFLDGYHATVSSNFFSKFMPSANQSLIPWSWLASRVFISVMLFFSWRSILASPGSPASVWRKPAFIYSFTATFTIACFLFFAFFPLPSGYLENVVIHRPAEYIAGLLFLVTLVGYLRKGDWETDEFSHWMVLCLIINLFAQILFMPTSGELFDSEFDTAHLLKKTSYICVMVGLLINMYRVFRDENTLKQMLSESSRSLQTIQDNIAESIICIDRQGIILSANSEALTEFGYSSDELTGCNIHLLIPKLDLAILSAEDSNIGQNGNWQELTGVNRKGRSFPIEIGLRVTTLEDRQIFVAIIRNIKQRKDFEDSMRKSEAKFRAIAENSQDLIVRFNRQCQHVYVNPALSLHLDLEEKDFLHKSMKDLSFPDSLVRKLESAIELVFTSGHPQSMNFSIPRGKNEITYDWKAYPEFSSEGKVESVLSISRDITQFKNREQQQRRLQKLESIGLIAGGIAHDFNNILVGIFGNISLAKSSLPDSHASYQHLDRAEKAYQRATLLTKQFLTFSEGGDPVKTRVDLCELIRENVEANLADSGTAVEFNFPESSVFTAADPGQLSQVFSNLTTNAVQAMGSGGRLDISLDAVNPDTSHAGLTPGSYYRIRFTDNGPGIAAEHIDRIFDPYFSTHQLGRGLGLATSHSVIKQHGGLIEVASRPGHGCQFTIFLPADTSAAVSNDSSQAAGRENHAGRILLLDDEEMVLDVTRRFLEKMGYQVDTTQDGTDTIEKFKRAREAGRPYACLIMDLTIPGGMGGRETMEIIRKLDRDALAIVASGYAHDSVMANYRDYGFAGVIPKPFTSNGLQQAVQSVLAKH